jgi:predicted nucleic acid-binding Zn ribbon protein
VRPLQHALPGALTEILRAAPLSDGKVAFAWRSAVGPALERVTKVKLEGRVLIVETASPQWSHEVMRSSPIILKRLQTFLGASAIEKIELRRA